MGCCIATAHFSYSDTLRGILCLIISRALHDEIRNQREGDECHTKSGDKVAPVSAQDGDDRGLFKVRLPDEEQCDGDAGLDRQIDILKVV